MADDVRHLSRLALNQAAEGLGSSEQRAENARHLETCAECRAALAELRSWREQFAQRLLEPSLPAVVRRAERWTLPGRWRLTLFPLPVLAMAAGLFLMLPRLHPAAELRAKGSDAALRVIGERNGAVFEVKDGQALREGDAIRFTIDAPGEPYLLIASVDGSGKVSVYVPFDGTRSVEISPDHRFVSQDAVRLDAAPGPERLFALFGRRPLAASEVAEQLRALARAGPAAIRSARALPLVTERQVSFLLEKEPR